MLGRSYRRAVPTTAFLLAATVLMTGFAPAARSAPAGRAPGDRVWNTLSVGGSAASALAVSPDGSMVFVTGTLGLFPDTDYATLAYDAATGAELWGAAYDGPEDQGGAAAAVGVSPDGSTVFVTGTVGVFSAADYATVAYDAHTGAELWEVVFDGPESGSDNVAALGVSSDGAAVFVTGDSYATSTGLDYATVAYDPATGSELWVSRYDGSNQYDYANALVVSPEGSTVFVTGSTGTPTGTSSDYGTVAYRASTGDQLWEALWDGLRADDNVALALGVSPDGSAVYVAGNCFSGSTVAYDAATGVRLWASAYDGTGYDLTVSPLGSAVYVSSNAEVIAYDPATGSQLWTYPFDGTANALAAYPDGSAVVVTGVRGFDGDYVTVALDAATGGQLWFSRAGRAGYDYASALIVSPDGSAIFVTGSGQIRPGRSVFGTVAYTA